MPVFDIYELDYRPTLTEKYTERHPLWQSIHIFLLFCINAPGFMAAVRSPAKTATAKVQVFIAIFIFILLFVYMILLFVTAGGIIAQHVIHAMQSSGLAAPTPPAASSFLSDVLQPIIVLVATIQMLWPSLRDELQHGALNYVSVIDYISNKNSLDVILGQFSNLLEHIAEKEQYQNIHLFAYSFGSVIAIDTLFPDDENPAERHKLISTFVTIGCLHSTLSMFWPNYFQNRKGWSGYPHQWFNLYSAADALASNFRGDNQIGDAEKGIQFNKVDEYRPKNLAYKSSLKRISVWSILILANLRAHADYWEPKYTGEHSCFDLIIEAMLKNGEISAMTSTPTQAHG